MPLPPRPRLAIFDFCETLVGFQTLDSFIAFVHQRHPTRASTALHRFFGPLKAVHLLPNFVYRRVQTRRLTGLTKATLDELAAAFVDQQVMPAENRAIRARLDAHAAHGDAIAIVSAGLAIYVNVYAARHQVPIVVATDLVFDAHGVCTGRIDPPDCIGSGKITKLRRAVALDDYDLATSSVYSDSMTDRPLFDLAGHRYLVIDNNECRPIS